MVAPQYVMHMHPPSFMQHGSEHEDSMPSLDDHGA